MLIYKISPALMLLFPGELTAKEIATIVFAVLAFVCAIAFNVIADIVRKEKDNDIALMFIRVGLFLFVCIVIFCVIALMLLA